MCGVCFGHFSVNIVLFVVIFIFSLFHSTILQDDAGEVPDTK